MKTKKPGSHPIATIINLTAPLYPRDFEFKPARPIEGIFSKFGLAVGRCFGSKSGYRTANPGNEFVPNANVFCRTRGKIWWGDLDLILDRPKLEAVSRRLRMRLYVLSEYDGRFANAAQEHSKVLSQAIWKTGGSK
jgi:hypothetical protein